MMQKNAALMLRDLLFWTWCLPQTLLGGIVFLLWRFQGRLRITGYKDALVIRLPRRIGGLSLGKFIFVDDYCSTATLRHEYGHVLQSFLLGPFYLLVVGIPSLVWVILSHVNPYYARTYHTRFPENWAERLGKTHTNAGRKS
jgi:hypothetical protein